MDSYAANTPLCDADGIPVDAINAGAATDDAGALTVSLINKDPEHEIQAKLDTVRSYRGAECYMLTSPDADSANDFDCPNCVCIHQRDYTSGQPISLPPHSLTFLLLIP